MQILALIFNVGSGLCHQLPERSYFFQGVQLPLCARCSGIYLGFVLALLLLLILYRKNPRKGGFSIGLYVVGSVFAGLMILDGFSSYLGFRETTNLIRLLTGSAFGVTLAAIVYLMMVDVFIKNKSKEKPLDTPLTLVGWVLMVPFTVVVLFAVSSASVYAGYLLLGLSVAVVFTAVTSVLVGLFPAFENRISSIRSALPAVAVSLLAASLLLYGTYLLQQFLHSLL